jgi:hypothetical protein
MMFAAAPLSGFAQGTASAPLAGKLLIAGSSTMAPGSRKSPGASQLCTQGVSISGGAEALPSAAEVRRERLP